MSEGELFPAESVQMDSPRLAWMKREKVLTYHSLAGEDGACWFAAFDEGQYEYEKGNMSDFFCQHLGATGDSECGEGDTEDESIAHLARRAGIKLWNEETP